MLVSAVAVECNKIAYERSLEGYKRPHLHTSDIKFAFPCLWFFLFLVRLYNITMILKMFIKLKFL